MSLSLPSLLGRRAAITMTTLALALGGTTAIAPGISAQEPTTATAETGTGSETVAEASTTDLSWGFKASWRNYVTSPWVGGTATASEGAAITGDGTYSFPQAPGATYNPATRTGSVDFTGAINFTSTNHGFNIDLKNPSITLAGDVATVSAELSVAAEPGTTEISRVDVAALQVATPEITEDATSTTYTFTALEGTFLDTIQPEALSRYVGEAIDPLSFSIVVDKTVDDNDGEGETPATGSSDDVSFLSRLLDLFRNLFSTITGLVTSS